MQPRCSTPVLGSLLAISLLTGCARSATAPVAEAPTAAPALSQRPEPCAEPCRSTVEGAAAGPAPTPTAEPLAALVNGQAITLAAFEKETARYEIGQRELGLDPASDGDYRAAVLDQMITAALIAQAARAGGVTVSDAEVEAEYGAVVEAAGGQAALEAWLARHLFTPQEFREALRDQLLASTMQHRIAAGVPAAGEQVHARHIVVATEAEAQSLLQRLESGADFATLAYTYSLDLSTRANGGDLGWFPRGRLTVPEVEAVVFDLAAGRYGPVVASALGYHVVQTVEHDPARALSPEDYQAAQERAVEQWIEGLWASAVVERFVTTGP